MHKRKNIQDVDYRIRLRGKVLKDFESGRLSITDILSAGLGIPTEDIAWIDTNPADTKTPLIKWLDKK